MLVVAVVIVAVDSDPKDACRAEMEQAYRAWENGQEPLARDLLLDAMGATCISQVR